MSNFFERPAPQQAVPGDLAKLRESILRSLTQGGASGIESNSVLGNLLGFTSGQNQDDMLKALRASADTRLNDQVAQLNSTVPGRFSSANIFTQGQLRERSQEDFNLLASQVMEQGRNRQLQSILSLLGPVLGPAFGGPFTQGSSGFENLLGGIGTVGGLGLFGGDDNR